MIIEEIVIRKENNKDGYYYNKEWLK